MTIAPEATRTHGELDCADAEALLHENTVENSDLRARLTLAKQAQRDAEEHLDLARLEADRLRALLDDVNLKNAKVANERDSMAAQIKFLHEELAALETDALPQGTLVYGALPQTMLTTEYRAVSRITRGPLPPAITAAVTEAKDTITEAMVEAGREALVAVVRREVRRRRRARR